MDLTTLIDRAVMNGDLDAALAPIMDYMDPYNERDLGGEAGVWFADKIDGWTVASITDRREILRQFLRDLAARHLQ